MSNVALLIGLITAYVIIIGFLGFVFISPTFRGALLAFFSQRLAAAARVGRSGRERIDGLGKSARVGGREGIRHVGGSLYRNRWLLGACALLVATPLALVVALRPQMMLDGFDDTPAVTNQLVAELLKGERLVPPPPLPPEAFTTTEVVNARPQKLLKEASRNWEQLDEDFEQRLLLTFKLMEEQHGYKMVLLEGYRSPERQTKLASMGAHVTKATAWKSWHQFGLAADCAFLRDGKVVISEKDPWAMRGYQLYGEVAESLGMVWGGRWKMMDLGHIELRNNARRKRILDEVGATVERTNDDAKINE